MTSRLILFALAALLLPTAPAVPALGAQEAREAREQRGAPEKQESAQAAPASKSARFESVARASREYREALEAGDLEGAKKLLGKDGAFRGRVVRIFSARSGSVVVLNFHEEYQKALTAVVRREKFGEFPDVTALVGKEVLVRGRFEAYRERPQIVLSRLSQLRLVK